jgi:hypothetical protein
MDGTPEMHEFVMSIAEEWSIATRRSVEFAFGEFPEAEIRISFSTEYLWSYVGTDALFVPRDKATLCLGAVATATDYRNLRAAILHEFGHALGLIHTPRYMTSHRHTGEPAHLGKGFNGYFMAALKGHFRNEIEANNVRDLVMAQSFRCTSDDFTIGGGCVMEDNVPSGYASNRWGEDTSVYRPWETEIPEKEKEFVRTFFKHDTDYNPFGLLKSKPESPVCANEKIQSS